LDDNRNQLEHYMMNIHSIGNGAHQASVVSARGSAAEKPENGEQVTSSVTQAVDEVAAVDTPERTKGVIRLLQEGHFKGVADVRLRMNFFDELSAIEHAGLSEAVEAVVPELQDTVNGQIDGLLASGELNEAQTAGVVEAQAVFNAATDEAVVAFSGSGALNTDGLQEGVQLAFDALVESLTPLLTSLESVEGGVLEAAEGEEPAVQGEVGAAGILTSGVPEASTEVTTAVPEETPPTLLSTFLNDLQNAFDTALEEVGNALASASSLPALSEPSGNGVAFEKFLAIYNEMLENSTATTEATAVTPPAIDTIV
jgi:microcompartment protein CcmK/EutM